MRRFVMVDENGMAYGMIWSESPEVTKPEGVHDLIEVENDSDYPAGKVWKNNQFVDPPENLDGEQKALRSMFRALAQTDVITPADAMDNAGMFPVWAEKVDTDAVVGEYLRYEDSLYRVKQAHKVQAHYPPSTATAALYSKVTMPGEIPDWTAGSWTKDIKVKHNGKIWLSIVDNNTWEPGAAGVYENIWKEVTV